MISELDETIRQVLIKEGGLNPSEVDVSFAIPDREWSAGISRPTINCYLFDIHEKRLYREEGWKIEQRGSNGATRRQPPLYFDLTYLITAWTRAVEDEHRLLWHVLQTLVRFQLIPEVHRQGQLRDYAWPIYADIAQMEGVLKSPGEFWTALENQIKPSLSYVVTLTLDREAIPAGPPVLTSGIRFNQLEQVDEVVSSVLTFEEIVLGPDGTPVSGALVEVEGIDHRPLLNAEGQPVRAITDAQGRFTLRIAPGRYNLIIQYDTYVQRREVTLHDPGYTLTFRIGGRYDE